MRPRIARVSLPKSLVRQKRGFGEKGCDRFRMTFRFHGLGNRRSKVEIQFKGQTGYFYAAAASIT
jgi:hypothetical protein